jgi:hypothetical protein
VTAVKVLLYLDADFERKNSQNFAVQSSSYKLFLEKAKLAVDMFLKVGIMAL